MEELSAKVKWNAVIAYFMVFVSVFFLISKDTNVSHPFVKSHVKSAFVLHLLIALVLFVMGYNFFGWIRIWDYSLNSIITALLLLFIFLGILYGMYMAHRWKRVTLWEIFGKIWVPQSMMQSNQSSEIHEETYPILILSHVPFIWYLLYGRNKSLPHIRDIVMLNFIVTLMSCFFFVTWYYSIASLLMLGYIIYSVALCISLVMNGHIKTINLDVIPGAEKKYIIQKSVFTYIAQTLKHHKTETLSHIIEQKSSQRRAQEMSDLEAVKKLPKSKLPTAIFYIPFVNIAWVTSSHTREKFHLRNGLVLTLLTLLLIFIFWRNLDILLFIAFPVFFGIGYAERKAYRMPYVYDIYLLYAWFIHGLWRVFHRTRELQNTDIKQSIKIWETKDIAKKETNTEVTAEKK